MQQGSKERHTVGLIGINSIQLESNVLYYIRMDERTSTMPTGERDEHFRGAAKRRTGA
jgi:hypothetical protein